MVHTCLEAAAVVEEEGIDVLVLDLRTLAPLDREAILEVARGIGKILIVHEDTKTAGLGAEVSATISEEAFEYLDAPIRRVTGPDVPAMPFSSVLESAFIPSAQQVAEAVRELVRY
jgi:2-oxoisovalerate dehydrogenase E1 component beta subunit